MTFEEALVRARAAHVVTATWNQPGNGYRTQYVCSQKCGAFGAIFADRWEQHIVDAADKLVAASNQDTDPASSRLAGWSPEIHAAELEQNQDTDPASERK